jgi:hypothetical protein
VTGAERTDDGRGDAGSPADAATTGEVGARTDAGATGDGGGVRELRAEPEPDWADAIRRGRRTRAERLRTVFASFDDEQTTGHPLDEQRERPQP